MPLITHIAFAMKHVYMSKSAYQKGLPPVLGINFCHIALLHEHDSNLDMSSQVVFKVKRPYSHQPVTPTQVVWRRLPLYMLSTLFLVRFDISSICKMTLDHRRPHCHHTCDFMLTFFIDSLIHDSSPVLRSRAFPHEPITQNQNNTGVFKAGLLKMYNTLLPPTISRVHFSFGKCCKRCYYYYHYCIGQIPY